MIIRIMIVSYRDHHHHNSHENNDGYSDVHGFDNNVDDIMAVMILTITIPPGRLLACSNAAMAVVMLESFDRIFKLSKSEEYIDKFRESEGMNALYQLLFKYNDSNIATRAERILSQVEDEVEEAVETLQRAVIG